MSISSINQFPEIRDYNLYSTDRVLTEYFQQRRLTVYDNDLKGWGEELGSSNVFHNGFLANEYAPVLDGFDSRGNRIDSVEFHPAWHRFKKYCKNSGLVSRPFLDDTPYRWSYAAAYFMLQTQVEAGALCPATMTLSCIPLLKEEPVLWEALKDKLLTDTYDARDVPVSEKKSIWVGMGVTEKQGGTDVRQNSTVASPATASGRGQPYQITGHKWFFSAPMSDAHLVVARTSDTGELCCFYVPRWKPDGTKNSVLIQRLKNKMGNKSNASSEVEFQNAYGILIGEEGRGIRTIMEMANYTRFCCVLGSSGIMRQAVVQALVYARRRKVFGKTLYEQPLMKQVLADMALEAEAAEVLSLRLAEAYENAESSSVAMAWKRFITPASKYWVCKRAEALTAEAMEIFGGNGYIEDSIMPRLYREAPVNSIWEGSGNVMCLDVLRVIEKSPDYVKAVLDDLREMSKSEASLRESVHDVEEMIQKDASEGAARFLAEQLILVAQACLLKERSPEFVSSSFMKLRLTEKPARQFGSFISKDIPFDKILERAFAG